MDRRGDAGEINIGPRRGLPDAPRSPVTDQIQQSSPSDDALTNPAIWQESTINANYEFGEPPTLIAPFDTELGLWTSSAGWDNEALQYPNESLLQCAFVPRPLITPTEHWNRPPQQLDYSKNSCTSVHDSYNMQIPVQLIHEL